MSSLDEFMELIRRDRWRDARDALPVVDDTKAALVAYTAFLFLARTTRRETHSTVSFFRQMFRMHPRLHGVDTFPLPPFGPGALVYGFSVLGHAKTVETILGQYSGYSAAMHLRAMAYAAGSGNTAVFRTLLRYPCDVDLAAQSFMLLHALMFDGSASAAEAAAELVDDVRIRTGTNGDSLLTHLVRRGVRWLIARVLPTVDPSERDWQAVRMALELGDGGVMEIFGRDFRVQAAAEPDGVVAQAANALMMLGEVNSSP